MEKQEKDEKWEKWEEEFFLASGWPEGSHTPESGKKALQKRKKGELAFDPKARAKEKVHGELVGHVKGLVDYGPAKKVGDKEYKGVMDEVSKAVEPVAVLVGKGKVLDVLTRSKLNVDVRKFLTDALGHYSKRQKEKKSNRREKKIVALTQCLVELDDLLKLDMKRREKEEEAFEEYRTEAKKQLLQPGGLCDQVNAVWTGLEEDPGNAKLIKGVLDDADDFTQDVVLSGMAQSLLAESKRKREKEEKKFDGDNFLEPLCKGLGDKPELLQKLYARLIDGEATGEAADGFFRGSKLAMKLIAFQKELPENKKYLNGLGGDVQKSLVKLKGPMEVDPIQRTENDPPVEDVVKLYKEIVAGILTSLDPGKVPQDICVSAYEIYRAFRENHGDRGEAGALSLASGHLFIRFFSPLFVVDLKTNFDPPPNVMRAGTMVSKILQNVGNGVLFTKEEYMKPFNEVVTAWQDRRLEFAKAVVEKGGAK